MEMTGSRSTGRLRFTVHGFVVLAVAFMFVAAGLQLHEQYRLTLAAAESVNLSIARALANNVAHIVRSAQFVQDHIVGEIAAKGLQKLEDPDGFDELHRLAERFPEITYITILDPSGKVIANSVDPNAPRLGHADHEFLTRHRNGEGLVLGVPFVSRLTGQEVFSITRGVFDGRRRLIAVVLIAIERAYLMDLFNARATSDTVTLIRDDGVILVRTPSVAVGEKLPATSTILRLAPGAASGSYETFSPIDGKERLFSYSKAGEHPAYVIASEIKANALAPWRMSIFRIALVLLAATVALYTAAMLILRALAREAQSRIELESSRRYQESLLNSMSAHVAILSPEGNIISTNKSWQDFALANGYSGKPDMVGKNYFDICRQARTEDTQRIIAGISSVMHGAAQEFRHVYDCSSPEENRWYAMTATPVLGHQGSVLLSHENVTPLKQAEELLRERAETDALTGLANRRRFLEMGTREFELARRHHKPLSLVMLDCDHFKAINDTYGHETGDLVLIAVADRIRQHIRHTDVAGRIGGEEFTILLPETSHEGAMRAAEEIRAAIAAKPVATPSGTVNVTASLGVAAYGTDMEDFSVLMRAADRALYAAKQGGRDRVESPVKAA